MKAPFHTLRNTDARIDAKQPAHAIQGPAALEMDELGNIPRNEAVERTPMLFESIWLQMCKDRIFNFINDWGNENFLILFQKREH